MESSLRKYIRFPLIPMFGPSHREKELCRGKLLLQEFVGFFTALHLFKGLFTGKLSFNARFYEQAFKNSGSMCHQIRSFIPSQLFPERIT